MSITRNNYEAYFLDYLEGNLNQNMLDEFNRFLTENPDLAAELDDMNGEPMVSLEANDTVFENKDALKKDVSVIAQEELDNTAIAYLENDLTITEKADFENLMEEDHETKKIFLLFRKTKLQADTSILFPAKSSIKRVLLFGLPKKDLYRGLSIAASILLVLSVFFIAEKNAPIDTKGGISENTDLQTEIPTSKQDEASVAKVSTPVTTLETESDQEDKTVAELVEKTEPAPIVESTTAKAKKKVKADDRDTPLKTEPKVQVDPNKQKTKVLDKKEGVKEKATPKLQNINPKLIEPAAKKKAAPKKRFVKPAQIHSQGLLASTDTHQQKQGVRKKKNEPLSIKQFGTFLFKRKILKQDKEEIDPNTLKLSEIADASFKGLSEATNNRFRISKEYDENGELIAYAVESPIVSWERDVKRKK